MRNLVIISLLIALAVYSYALMNYGHKKYEPQVQRYKAIETNCSIKIGPEDTKCYTLIVE